MPSWLGNGVSNQVNFKVWQNVFVQMSTKYAKKEAGQQIRLQERSLWKEQRQNSSSAG